MFERSAHLVRLAAADDNGSHRLQRKRPSSAARRRGQERATVPELQPSQRDHVSRTVLNRVMAAAFWPVLVMDVVATTLLAVSGLELWRIIAVAAVYAIHFAIQA